MENKDNFIVASALYSDSQEMGVCGEEISKLCLPMSSHEQKDAEENHNWGSEREGEAGEDEEFGGKWKGSLLRKTLFCSAVKP